MNRLNLPTICPELSAYVAAGVTISVPFTDAPWVFPVADLYFTTGTVAGATGVKGSNSAVGVNTHAVCIGRQSYVVIYLSITVGVVIRLNVKCRTNSDAIIVAC